MGGVPLTKMFRLNSIHDTIGSPLVGGRPSFHRQEDCFDFSIRSKTSVGITLLKPTKRT